MSDQSQALQRIEVHQTLDAVQRKLAIDELLNKVALVMETMDKVMQDGTHYGKVPGCGDKKILFKAGAEKLGLTFKLKPTFVVDEKDLGGHHREYSVVCTLTDGTQGVGTCSTLETKYRYRKVYENGQSKKVEHDNPADNWNTCLKMGKKRAHVDAIITATASSDILTQDMEEVIEAADATGVNPSVPMSRPQPTVAAPTKAPTSAPGEVSKTHGQVLGLADKCKARFLAIIKEKALEPEAWLYAVDKSWILPSEQLKDARADKFPTTMEAADKALSDIQAICDRLEQAGGMTQEETEAYETAHLEIVAEFGLDKRKDEPWRSIPIPKWSKHFKEDGLKTFGELSKEKLWYWAVKWIPAGYNGKPPKQEDVALRAELDKVRDAYGFTEAKQ